MIQWIDPEPTQVPKEVEHVVPALAGWGPLVAELLVRRGITNADIARGFIDWRAYTPALPQELPDLQCAVDQIAQAIRCQERIAIWGDFDVDGQAATALYLQALRELGADVVFYIPTRRESHGVHPRGVQRLIEQGARLILTADTGTDAYEALALAARYGVDILVTDHHDLVEPPLAAQALVNPKRLPAGHPLYELSGVGVAYQVARALYERAGKDTPEHLLDLVALGIIADVATLRGDVRYLVQRGLQVLRASERLGLREMMGLAQLNPALVSEEDIRFALAPRLNALTRIGEQEGEAPDAATEVMAGAMAGVELLTSADRIQARTIAAALESLNARRRWFSRQATDVAMAQLERDRALLDGPAIVVASALWDPGIVGIVASQLVERFHKPAVVLSAPPGEIARGSARSVEGIDIHAAIATQRTLLRSCGGHPMAAGLSVDQVRIDEFRQALWHTLEQMALPPAEPTLHIDAYLGLSELTPDLAQAVALLSPFGSGNDPPVFVTRDLTVVSNAVLGRTREHRRVVVQDAEQREQMVFWWRGADRVVPEGPFDLAYTIGLNTFRGEQEIQLTWVDARALAPCPLTLPARPQIQVVDCRPLPDFEPALRDMVASGRAEGERLIVWGERVQLPGVSMYKRSDLVPAETLVIWTAPPGPAELGAALEAVSPEKVVLFGLDPGPDTATGFLRRLGGLVKHALHARGGQTSLVALAAAMAHSEHTVRLGLMWLAQQGGIEVTLDPGGQVLVRRTAGETVFSGVRADERRHRLQGQLQAQLEETAAYRAYFRQADGERLIGGLL